MPLRSVFPVPPSYNSMNSRVSVPALSESTSLMITSAETPEGEVIVAAKRNMKDTMVKNVMQ